MLTSSHSPTSLAATFIAVRREAGRWIHSLIVARRERIERRRTMALLLELRDRDPRLFEETRVDPIDLPPPASSTILLFPQVVISRYFIEGHR